jgi:autotransporter-associated beta strand protein
VTGINGLTTTASSILRVVSTGGPLSIGTTDLISHSGPIQGSGLGGFQLTGIGHATATLQDTGSVVRLNVTQATETIQWTGATNSTWNTITPNQNWKFQTGGAATSYLEGDDVRFADLAVPAATTVNISALVTPSRITIDNTAANPYTFTGATITGPTTLTKNGAGTVIFQNVLSHTGATNLNAGTLKIGVNNAIPVTATLNLGQNDGNSANFDLNGFNQTLAGLVYTAGTGGTKMISNSATAPSTLTFNQPNYFTSTTMGALLSGNLAIVQDGPGGLRLTNGGSTFTGNITVNGGTLTASAPSDGTTERSAG